ncbi:hypothetical protein ONS96_000045 [Cadophora gregata f. sp. sojae]|nr:hypothetical protein ONS96_000045 [Cadophora gregata f. sp. sojae]
MPKSKKQPLNTASKALFTTWLRGSKSAPAIMAYKEEESGESSTSFSTSVSSSSLFKELSDDTPSYMGLPVTKPSQEYIGR